VERAKYAWEILVKPGRPGHYFRSALGLYLGFIAAAKLSGDLSIGNLVFGAAITIAVVGVIGATQKS